MSNSGHFAWWRVQRWVCLGVALASALHGFPPNHVNAQTTQPQFSTGWDHKLFSNVVTQLRSASRDQGTGELSDLLDRVRIAVPFRSINDDIPNAYALPPTRTANFVVIEAKWIDEIAGLAELAALFGVATYGPGAAQVTRALADESCVRYSESYRQAQRRNEPVPGYLFRRSDFRGIYDTTDRLTSMLFDKLSGIVLSNTMVWTVLHEVGHHALKHSGREAADNALRKQRELDADKWAFEYMTKLGYSVFGASIYLQSRAFVEACFGDVAGSSVEAQTTTHPSWSARLQALRSRFDLTAAPARGLRILFMPEGLPEPTFATITIQDPLLGKYDATIVQLGKLIAGFVESRGKSATVYVREAGTGGRIELVIEDATRMTVRIDERTYDANNRQTKSIAFQAIQQEQASLEFLEVNGHRFGDIVKRTQGNNLLIVHLRRVGASDAAIRDLVAENDQFQIVRRRLGLEYRQRKNIV